MPTARRILGEFALAKYWELDHTAANNRRIERIHHQGLRSGWRDREAEGTTRNDLLGLRVNRALDRASLLADMRARGHGDGALSRLDRLIDKTYAEPEPHPEAQQ